MMNVCMVIHQGGPCEGGRLTDVRQHFHVERDGDARPVRLVLQDACRRGHLLCGPRAQSREAGGMCRFLRSV